jgi:hypothetical protein
MAMAGLRGFSFLVHAFRTEEICTLDGESMVERSPGLNAACEGRLPVSGSKERITWQDIVKQFAGCAAAKA